MLKNAKQPTKNFEEVLASRNLGITNKTVAEQEGVVPLIQTPPPRREGSNLVVTIDEGEYYKGLEENQYNVIGMLSVRRGDPYLSTIDLRKKLQDV